MLIPVSTDAPVYYWPYATVGLILANVLVFIGMAAGAIDPTAGWLLEHGTLNPISWLLSIFAHADFFHLFGNMVALWVFGLVVEGKLGWLKFLACYLAIGVGESAVEQLFMVMYVGDPSYSCGASTAIYGILAMAAVWAPKNEITMFYWFVVMIGTFDVAIGWLAAFYIGWDLALVLLLGALTGPQVTSSLLHVLGAAIGFPLAILLLKRSVVDCEGWDIFHIWSGDYGGRDRKEKEDLEFSKNLDERRKRQAAEQEEAAKEQVHKYLESGNSDAAKTLVDKLGESGLDIMLGEEDLVRMINGLHKRQRWAESAPMMAKLIRVAPERADLVRLKLAQICVIELERPGRALDLLDDINPGQLTPPARELAGKIRRRAEEMQSEGVVEFDDDRW